MAHTKAELKREAERNQEISEISRQFLGILNNSFKDRRRNMKLVKATMEVPAWQLSEVEAMLTAVNMIRGSEDIPVTIDDIWGVERLSHDDQKKFAFYCAELAVYGIGDPPC